jgi:hypothetical protein
MVLTDVGAVDLAMPRDRKGSFDSKIAFGRGSRSALPKLRSGLGLAVSEYRDAGPCSGTLGPGPLSLTACAPWPGSAGAPSNKTCLNIRRHARAGAGHAEQRRERRCHLPGWR